MSNKAYIATNINRGFVFKDDYTEFISGNTGINQFLDGYLFSQIRTLNPEIKEVFYRNIEGLKAIISDEYEKQEALNMALEVMDISLSEEYRIGIAGLLDTEISNHPEYLGFIKNRLHSTALPDLFNTVFIDAKKSIFSKEFISLYDDIKEKARLFNCFHTLLKLSLNLEIAELELIDSRLTDNGAYAAFTNAISQYSQKKYYQAVIIAIPVLEELHFFTNKQLFIEIETKLFENYQIKLEEHSFLDVSGNQFKVSDSPDPIIQLIERYIDEKQVKHDEKRSKRGMARRVKDYEREMNSIVTEMKEWLVKNSYNGPIFFKQFESVAEKQLRSGHPEHLCKTCCDLATIFIEKSQFAISETLLTYAELLNPEDKYVHTQKAVLFHKQNKLEKALEQYDEVIKKFGEDSVGYNGRAEVLRDLGRPEEALKQYDEAIIKFSEDSVGYNGRAEVLRDLGRPEEALKQYDEVIKKFRENSVGYNGRAEVLRDLGRPEEALKQYDEVIKKFSEDTVGYNGRAEVLRDLGRPEEALKQYDESIKKFSEDAVGYNGRAEVLRDLGRIGEALKQYDEVIKKFNEAAFGYNGRAEVLRDLGRPEEALKQYDEVIKKFSEVAVGYNGRAEVLRDLGRPEEALKQYDEVIKLFPFDDVSKKGRIQVLLEEDKYDEFNKAIKKVNYITFGDYVQLHMYCMYLIKVGDWEQAREKIAIGLASPFNQHRKYFKNINAYLDILKNQFSNALKELDSIRIHTPAQSLLIIHANAENNTKQKAIKELHKLESIKRPVIYITLGYLSERYSLNGFKKTNKTKEDLDKLIQEGEMKALLQY